MNTPTNSAALQAHTLQGGAQGDVGLKVGDCVQILATLPATSTYDIIIADPPYNIGKDFGTNHDRLPLDAYLRWMRCWIDRCRARLSARGVMYIYGFSEILARVAAQYPIEEQRWLVWHYTNKTVPSARFWQRTHESILCLWRPGQSRPELEVEQIREPYTPHYLKCVGRARRATESRFGGRRGKPTLYGDHGGALPRDVIKIPALAGGAGAAERWFMCRDCDRRVFPPHDLKHHRGHDVLKHPTQKPMALTQKLLRSCINGSGGRLLVPFAGSGSECVVAQRLGVAWLGIEINPEYGELARKWLAQVSHV